MAQDRAKQMLQQGIAAAKAGQKPQAFEILQRVVKLDPQNETAWLWLSSVARSQQERVFCLRQLYSVNPNNELAIKGLQALGIDPTKEKVQAEPTPESDTPLPTPEKLRLMRVKIDTIVNDYNPELYTPLEIDWEQKEKNRYGEATAKRIRRTFYGTVGTISFVALALVGFLLYSLISGLGGDEQAARDNKGLFTATASLIPSITPTFTPNPNTPIPGNLFASPTPLTPQPNLPRGFDSREAEPTQVYPRVSQRQFLDIVDAYDAGNYAEVRRLSEPYQDENVNSCFPETYYYDMLGRGQSGDLDELAEAERLLNQALNFEERAGFENFCVDSDLLKTALCFVDHQQALLGEGNSNDALLLCQEALNADPQLVFAAITLADIYISQGDYDTAAAVLEQTRTYEIANGGQPNIGNVNLMLKQIDVEIAKGDYDSGLAFVSQVLYVDPVLEAALDKQSQILLLQARAEEDTRLQQILYGYAALVAEEQYLFRYPGAAQVYVYIAEGRFREGNPERALENLERVLQVADDPTIDPEAIQNAYALRAEIRYTLGNFEGALADINIVIENDPDTLDWRILHSQAALALQDYESAEDDLALLVATYPERSDLAVELAYIQTQICASTSSIRCNYDNALALLNDDVIAAIDDPLLLARAQSYRIEAEFALDDEPSTQQASAWINTLTTAMQSYETVDNYYLLGRLYQATEQYDQALLTYQWIVYWNTFYAYPFTSDVQDNIETVEALLAEQAEQTE